ncbi:HepT-like ribonuclease domain-containing protein [Ruminococcus sp.]|uniref:HepT-like ribonuclease domain-containing protein n=1 Tax=Ruminococcus sp. TaxID=41978 RepID=UPI0025F400B0|nr:HepT-like ribonuclease domain-containing protein [Ruminococcus sp.]
MQIGELAKQSLSDEAKAQIKTIPWKQIYGMRNRIVHGYSGVNMLIVWDTIHDDLPELKKELQTYLK